MTAISVTSAPALKPRNRFKLIALSVMGVFAAIIALGVFSCFLPEPVLTASGSGWAPTPVEALANLKAAYPGVALSWSPVIHERGVGDYRAMWFGNGQLRAYVGPQDSVSALSVSQDLPADLPSAEREAARFVLAAAPKADQNAQAQTAFALANLIVSGQKTMTIDLAGVEFKVSAGMLHYSLRAKPIVA